MPRKKAQTWETEQAPFPSRLGQIMSERKVSQETLASAIGVKRQTVSLYKTGQSSPNAEHLIKIAEFFNVSADWLLGLTNDKQKVPSPLDRLGLSESALAALENLVKQCRGEHLPEEALKELRERDEYNREWANRPAEYDSTLYTAFSVKTKEELAEALWRWHMDEDTEEVTADSRFEAKLVLDMFNLLLSRESELHILKNLALYVFAGQPNNESVDMCISGGLGKDNNATVNATISSSQLSNIFLLEAENLIRKLKDTEERYQIWSMEAGKAFE